jgi:uroporphyrinogen-III synthase
MSLAAELDDQKDLGFLHEIGTRIAAADPIHNVLELVVEFVTSVVNCDSCFVYVMEGKDLILRASKNPHEGVVDRLKLRIGQGITGWVAEHKKPVALTTNASLDPRFQFFDELPEDRYEAILAVPVLCRDKLVGVINVQHRESHHYSRRDIQLVSTVGFLIGPEIEMARVEVEHSRFLELSEARKLVDDAIQILQRDMGASHEDAQTILRRYSRQSGRSMKEVAEAILLSDEIKRPQDHRTMQRH